MKKFIILTALIFCSIISFGQTFFSKGFISNGNGVFRNDAKIQMGDFYLVYDADSMWIENPLGVWFAKVTTPQISVDCEDLHAYISVTNDGVLDCNNPLIQLTASSNQTDVSYQWDGSTSGDLGTDNPLIAFLEETITLTVTNNTTGCERTEDFIITTDFLQPVLEKFITSTNIDDEIVLGVFVTNPQARTEYEYSWAGTGISTNADAQSIRVNATGDFTATVTNKNTGCNDNATISVVAGDFETSGASFTASNGIEIVSNDIQLNTNYFSVEADQSWESKATTQNWQYVSISFDGKYQLATTYNDYLYISSDYGETWASTETVRSWYGGAVSGNGKYMAATVNSGGIYLSDDYGETWTLSTAPTPSNWVGVTISYNGKYMSSAIQSGGIYLSDDYGATWTLSGSAPSSGAWTGISMNGSGKYQTAVYNGDQIYISDDYGAIFTGVESTRSWEKVSVSFIGEYQTVVVDGGQIYVSDDYGATWTAYETNRNWRGIAISSTGQYQVASAYSGNLYYSSDYGQNWASQGTSQFWQIVDISATGDYASAMAYGNNIYIKSPKKFKSQSKISFDGFDLPRKNDIIIMPDTIDKIATKNDLLSAGGSSAAGSTGDIQLNSGGTFASSNDLEAGSIFNWDGEFLQFYDGTGNNYLEMDLSGPVGGYLSFGLDNGTDAGSSMEVYGNSFGVGSYNASGTAFNFYIDGDLGTIDMSVADGDVEMHLEDTYFAINTDAIEFQINDTEINLYDAGSGLIWRQSKQLSGSLTDGAPTDAEIDAILVTTPASFGAGGKVTIKDTDGTGLLYQIESDGTDWYYIVMTKAL